MTLLLPPIPIAWMRCIQMWISIIARKNSPNRIWCLLITGVRRCTGARRGCFYMRGWVPVKYICIGQVVHIYTYIHIYLYLYLSIYTLYLPLSVPVPVPIYIYIAMCHKSGGGWRNMCESVCENIARGMYRCVHICVCVCVNHNYIYTHTIPYIHIHIHNYTHTIPNTPTNRDLRTSPHGQWPSTTPRIRCTTTIPRAPQCRGNYRRGCSQIMQSPSSECIYYMCVYVYVCIYMCIYICLYVFICVYMEYVVFVMYIYIYIPSPTPNS